MTQHSRRDVEEEEPTRAGSAVDAARALRAIRNRWWLPAGGLLLGLGLGIGAFLAWPKTFASETVLRFEGEVQDPISEMGAAAQTVLLPEQMDRVRAETGRHGELFPFLEISTEPPLMRIRASGGTADEARELADTTADSFLTARRLLAQARLDDEAEHAAHEVSFAQESLARIQGEQRSFREEHGIANLPEERQHLIEEAAELRARAEEQRIEAEAQEARQEALQNAAANLPTLTRTVRMNSGAAEALATARQQLQQAQATLTDAHPRVQALQARVRELEARVEADGATVATTMSVRRSDREAALAGQREAAADAESAGQRAESFEALAERALERARELSDIEGQAATLAARVRIATQAHGEALERLSAVRDAEAVADYRLENAASEPEAQASKKPLAALIGFPLGLMILGMLIAVGRDLGKLRVMTAKEVAWWGGGPVLGVSEWPRDSRGLDALVAELEDLARDAVGRTLVVPVVEDDRELACAFAARLAEAPWMHGGIVDVESEPIEAESVVIPPAPEDAPRQRDSVVTMGKDTIIMAAPPDMLDPAFDPDLVEGPTVAARRDTVMEAERVSRMTVRMFVTPGGGISVKDLEDALAEATGVGEKPEPNRPSRMSFAGTKPVVVAAPSVVVGPESRQSVTVAGTVKVEGRPAVNLPSAAITTVVRSLMTTDREVGGYQAKPQEPEGTAVVLAWNGPLEGPMLRRAARLADRVLVVVRGGRTGPELRAVRPRLGRFEDVGFVVVAVDGELAEVDRVGDVQGFWRGGKVATTAPAIERVATVKSQRVE